MCQCPRRALLISTDLGITFGFRWIIVCQCPRRALLISTKEHNTMIKLAAIGVSMPSAGSSHFYRYNNWEGRQLGAVCQCPRRALLISTPIDLTLFTDGTAVSMPSAGSSHFYVTVDQEYEGTYIVSMPSAGSSHFYKSKEEEV